MIVGLISGDTELFAKVRKILESRFGRIDFESEPLNFDNTDYYQAELGEKLRRKFLSFGKQVDLKKIYKIKLYTNSLEKRFSESGKRRVNIDPGYLNLSKLVLLSTKDYSHRIYLNKGIFAEATLFYKDKTFNPWPWTYPDYRSEEYVGIFNSIRKMHKAK